MLCANLIEIRRKDLKIIFIYVPYRDSDFKNLKEIKEQISNINDVKKITPVIVIDEQIIYQTQY